MNAAERLDQWAALADGATPEPWTAEGPWSLGHTVVGPQGYLIDAVDGGVPCMTEPDATFTAAARSAVPALIAALKAVLRELPGGIGDPYTSGEYDSGWDAGRFDLAVKIRAAIESALGATS